jgi:cytochrome c-type biogenesis protein CcmF
MIPELGHFALVLALIVAAVQGVLPLAGRPAVAGPAAALQAGLIALAFAALTWAHVVSDFTVLNVAANSHSAKPMLYKVTGVWGNHEGSMLLWSLVLALFGAAAARFGGLPPGLRERTLAVQGLLGAGVLLFILTASNPFLRVIDPPFNGRDLNPLLQDPGLAFHPPFLYLGYVGFALPFSMAAAALIEGRVDGAWARWARPWTLAAWIALTLGIAMGSWWAYYELGWGGWWYWDPVENASLMPWLAGTALLHSLAVLEKREALKAWTMLLAILTFSLSLMGTFLVRSGVLTSVHAFAVDPARGAFILGLMVVVTGGALTLFAWRAPLLRAGAVFHPLSREGALVLNNLLLSTAVATVFIGTLYPLFLDAVGGPKVSVGAPYFAMTFAPLMAPMVAATAVAPFLGWKRADLAGALSRLRLAGLAALAAALLALALQGGPARAVLGLGLAAWVVAGTLVQFAERIGLFTVPPAQALARAARLPRAAWGMTVAHAGLGVLVAGMVAASAWTVEDVRTMRPGERVPFGVHELVFEKAETRNGPNYRTETGVFALQRAGRTVAVLEPERRLYPVTGMITTESAIRTTAFGDLYIALGERGADGTWVVRLYRHPLVPWIWAGAGLLALGGLLSLSSGRGAVRARRAKELPSCAA